MNIEDKLELVSRYIEDYSDLSKREELKSHFIDDYDDPKDDPYWSFEEMDYLASNDIDSLLEVIIEILNRNPVDSVLSCLAAGPLEDALSRQGPKIIDRVESLSKSNSKFALLLGGVWKNAMTEDVWNRVQSIRNEK